MGKSGNGQASGIISLSGLLWQHTNHVSDIYIFLIQICFNGKFLKGGRRDLREACSHEASTYVALGRATETGKQVPVLRCAAGTTGHGARCQEEAVPSCPPGCLPHLSCGFTRVWWEHQHLSLGCWPRGASHPQLPWSKWENIEIGMVLVMLSLGYANKIYRTGLSA